MAWCKWLELISRDVFVCQTKGIASPDERKLTRHPQLSQSLLLNINNFTDHLH